jgi:hypothetical protein
MRIEDVNRQELEVKSEFTRGRRIRITINPGKPDERDILLDAQGARELAKAIVDAL